MTNCSRRVLLGAFAALPGISVLADLMPAAAAAPQKSAAEQFIRQSGERLVNIVNGPGSASQKAHKLRVLVDEIVAVSQIGRFVLGRFWNVATPEQRQQYMALFHKLLAFNITTQIRAYVGITFQVLGAQNGPEGEMVSTVINRPDHPPANVQWVVQDIKGALKIIDVVVEGTSLRITERSDYASVISDNGGQVAALLEAMKNQLKRMEANE